MYIREKQVGHMAHLCYNDFHGSTTLRCYHKALVTLKGLRSVYNLFGSHTASNIRFVAKVWFISKC